VPKLNLANILEDASNTVAIPMVEELDLNVAGSSTTPITVSFSQWTELDGDPNPTSLAVVVSEVELWANVVDPTFNWSNFLDGASPTTGQKFQITKEGVTITMYPTLLLTNADLGKYFADFTATADTGAAASLLKAVRNFLVEDGDYLYMDGTTSDAISMIISDDLSSANDFKMIIRGFGFVAKS
jgi:hypothetical protein